jgi:hypothetical protein
MMEIFTFDIAPVVELSAASDFHFVSGVCLRNSIIG